MHFSLSPAVCYSLAARSYHSLQAASWNAVALPPSFISAKANPRSAKCADLEGYWWKVSAEEALLSDQSKLSPLAPEVGACPCLSEQTKGRLRGYVTLPLPGPGSPLFLSLLPAITLFEWQLLDMQQLKLGLLLSCVLLVKWRNSDKCLKSLVLLDIFLAQFIYYSFK